MKIDKIRLIEQPNEEMLLNTEAMEDLLGGIICGILAYGHCSGFSTVDCGGPGDLKCGSYQIPKP